MLASAQPVGFIPSTDLDRSRRFYEGTLGLQVVSADHFAVVVDAGGFTIRITDVGATLRAQPFTVFGWRVENVHDAIAQLVGRGVGFLRFEGLEQDDAGVWTAPGSTHVAWFKDPEGNTLSVHDS